MELAAEIIKNDYTVSATPGNTEPQNGSSQGGSSPGPNKNDGSTHTVKGSMWTFGLASVLLFALF